jgi:hypothetical protein
VFTERTLFSFRNKFEFKPQRNLSNYRDYFPQNYDHSRNRFLSHFEEFKKQGLPAEHLSFNVPSKYRSDLFVDACFIPNENNEKLIILTTGVHGLEAPTGSAAIEVFINEFLNKSLKRGFSLLIVHCLNPFGFAYNRRVTENNVDLNRNFFIENRSGTKYNPLYYELRALLNPQIMGSLKSGARESFRVLQALRKNNFQNISRAIAFGQKQFPGGLFYAGEYNEPQTVWLKNLLVSKCSHFEKTLAIDIHTGYGERGKLYNFGHTFRSESEEYFTKQLFSDLKIYSVKDDGFYETAGDLSSFIAEIFKGRKLASMTFEVGTVNNHKPINQIRDFYKLVRENQIFNDHSIPIEIKETLLKKLGIIETYSPNSLTWRNRAIDQMADSFHLLLNRYHGV